MVQLVGGLFIWGASGVIAAGFQFLIGDGSTFGGTERVFENDGGFSFQFLIGDGSTQQMGCRKPYT
jgi:hypothetical protein